jgi:hypothetical protein
MTANFLQQTLDVAGEPAVKPAVKPVVKPVVKPKHHQPATPPPNRASLAAHQIALQVACLPPRSPQPLIATIEPIEPIEPIDRAIEPADESPDVLVVQSAMQRLVARIMHLQSSGRVLIGTRSSLLLSYVQTETKDLIKALHRSLAARSRLNSSAELAVRTVAKLPAAGIELTGCLETQRYIWLNALTPWLVWGTSRTSHEIMRLLAGQMVRVLCPNQSWQAGTLRLVPFLSLRCSTDRPLNGSGERPAERYTVDLISDDWLNGVSNGVPRSVLPANAGIYFDSAICQQPASVSTVLHHLQAQIQQTTPSIAPYLQGIAAQVWLPQQSWRSGKLQLHYRLEFAPLLPPPTALAPLIKFADGNWLQQYAAAIHHQQVSDAASQVTSQAMTNHRLPSATELLATACTVSDHLQNNLAIVSRLFTPQELELKELLLRLRWGLLHSSYEGMQLLRGIPVTVGTCYPHLSQPQPARLRFAIHLHLRSRRQAWKLDVMAEEAISEQPAEWQGIHQANKVMPTRLLPTTIVQSRVCAWCQSPRSLHQLQTLLWQQIHIQTPELKLLQQPTPIELYPQQLGSDLPPIWRSGVMQLKGQFEFTATSVQSSAKSGN